MEKKTFLCVLYIILFVAPGPILARKAEHEKSRNKRQAQALLPIAAYAGMTVSAPVFIALVAAYGLYQVTKYAIKKAKSTATTSSGTDYRNHACGGWFKDGRCRPRCLSGEYEDWRSSDVCGGWKCCKWR